MDKREYADRLVLGSEDYFSPDYFLDTRAFVVARGREFYESVLLGSSSEEDYGICEELVNLPAKAWKQKTGTDFEYLPTKNYFTYSNPDGWENTLLDLLQK